MKKIISIILLAAMCLSLASCEVLDAYTADPLAKDYEEALALLANCDYEGAKAAFEKLGDYKDAKDYLAKFYYMPVSFEYDLIDKKGTNKVLYNGENLPIGEVVMRPDVQAIYDFVYDDNGTITKQVLHLNSDTEILESAYEYYYDSNGYLIRAEYNAYDGYWAILTFIYDENRNIPYESYEDESGLFEYVKTIDENGNVAKYEQIYNGESVLLEFTYEFDNEGRIVKEICTLAEVGQETVEYVLDTNGKVVKEIYTDYQGEQDVTEYTYDNYGNVIYEVFTDDDGVVQYVKTEYELLYIPYGITVGTEVFLTGFWGDRL
jgi:hypothetical protein